MSTPPPYSCEFDQKKVENIINLTDDLFVRQLYNRYCKRLPLTCENCVAAFETFPQ